MDKIVFFSNFRFQTTNHTKYTKRKGKKPKESQDKSPGFIIKHQVTILVTWCYNEDMRIFSRRMLREFWEKHPDSKVSLQTWFHDVQQADWKNSEDIKSIYRNASFVANNRVVFNIKGNHYRLVVVVVYQYGVVYIRFVGTHDEYNRIEVNTI